MHFKEFKGASGLISEANGRTTIVVGSSKMRSIWRKLCSKGSRKLKIMEP